MSTFNPHSIQAAAFTAENKPGPARPEPMTDYRATALAEGFETTDDPEEVRAAWQHLVDTGLAYRLQGWFGRTAERLIEAGEIKRRKAERGPDGQFRRARA